MLAAVAAVGLGAGAVGSMLGIGGGVFLVPLFSVLLGIPIRVAVATSLVAVVATAAAGADVYLRQGLTDVRLAILLELPTVVGAIAGSMLAVALDQKALSLIFALVALYTAWTMLQERSEAPVEGSSVEKAPLKEVADPPTPFPSGAVAYRVEKLPLGLAMSALGGVASGLLGIGGGIIKVPVLKLAMEVPMRVAVATSNFMVGITAVASVGVYMAGGYVDPQIAASAALAVLMGASAGARLASRIDQKLLARGFAILLATLAIQILVQAL